MKRMVFTAVLLLSMTTLFAQRPGGGAPQTPEESAKRQSEWMKTELKDLNKKQIASVDSLNLVYAKKQAALFQKLQDGDRSKFREESQKLNDEKTKALTPILTKAQMETYKKALEQRRQNRGNGGGGWGGGNGGNGGGGNRGGGNRGGGNGGGGGR